MGKCYLFGMIDISNHFLGNRTIVVCRYQDFAVFFVSGFCITPFRFLRYIFIYKHNDVIKSIICC